MSYSQKELIVLTTQFPYGNQEAFLELEIVELAQIFNKIRIVPTTSTGAPRNIPLNCEVVKLPNNLTGTQKYLELFNPISIYKAGQVIFKEMLAGGSKEFFQAPIKSFKKSIFIHRYSKWVDNRFKDKNQGIETIIYSYWFDPIILAWKNYSNSILVCRSHSSDTYKGITNQILKHGLLANVSKVFCISDFVQEYVKVFWKAPYEKIALSRLGVRIPIKEESFKDNSSFTIVSCSNMIPLKRTAQIAQAILNIKAERKIKWYHFGDGECRQEVEELIQNYQKNELFELQLMGSLPNQEILNFYEKNKVDVFVNFSESEGIPVSIMEAFSYEIPAICADVGACSEIVKNGHNGVLLPSDASVFDLTKAIQDLLKLDHIDKTQMNKNALNTVKQDYSVNNYSKFAQSLNSLK